MMNRVLLRAVLEKDDGSQIVAHTLELSDARTFVATDENLAAGARVRVRLSFPRLVSDIRAVGTVIERSARGGPGDPAGLVLALELDDADERRRFAELLRAVDETAVSPTNRSYRVLLVEDSNLVREMFTYGIRRHFQGRENVIVDHASDGAMAWSMLSDGDYDLAIVDYFLPVLNGAELVQRMRSDEKLRGVSVVAISVGGPDARAATLAAGADLFLDKPLVLKDLFSTIERLNAQGAVG